MEIRPGTEEDTSAIVELLKVSLGEGLVPKSEAYWVWKHVENPFGRSPVLVAVDAHKLVGVRAFMRWQWNMGQKHLEAVRAVDTATHPDYQGKGVFSKLTRKLLDDLKSSGYDLVFNTPNSKSMPGYLKMGWEKSGRLPITVSLPKPIATLFHLFGGNGRAAKIAGRPVEELLSHSALPALLEANRKFYDDKWVTPHSPDFLKWRYQTVPVETYYFDAPDQPGLESAIIYRIKETIKGIELRVTDVFLGSAPAVKGLRNLLRRIAAAHRADFITMSGLMPFAFSAYIPTLTRLSMGPHVTVRKVNIPVLNDFVGFRKWSPSLGDLELF